MTKPKKKKAAKKKAAKKRAKKKAKKKSSKKSSPWKEQLDDAIQWLLHEASLGQALNYYDLLINEYQAEDEVIAYLGKRDRFFLLTHLCSRPDAIHEWLYARCREVENDPDGHKEQMKVAFCPTAKKRRTKSDWGTATTAWRFMGGEGSYGLNLWLLPEKTLLTEE